LHGDLDQSLRTKTLDSFRSGELKLLVASDVAARGLDIPAVSHIFNFDVPFHPDDYVHRIGRTGRAGRTGHALMLATPRDGRQVDAIEHLIKTMIPRQTMENLEIREDRKPRSDHERKRGARERQRKDKFRPDKFHDHVAPMEPAAPVAVAPEKVAEPVSDAMPARRERKHEPRREQHRQKKRDPEHKASFDRKNDATPVKPEKHQLPAFLFRPVPVAKKADAES
jgi:superfamily II DNA/RNA helicase